MPTTSRTININQFDSTANNNLVTQFDVGTEPNEIPLNQYLGSLAYRDIALVSPPAAANSVGQLGEIACANGYIYVCISSNTWQRANVATWT